MKTLLTVLFLSRLAFSQDVLNEVNTDGYLSGKYRGQNGETLVIDSYGRIANPFTVKLTTSVVWPISFPHSLKSAGQDEYATEGDVIGTWIFSDGTKKKCEYPASIEILATNGGSLIELTLEYPADFYDTCNWSGVRHLRKSFVKIQ